MYKEGTCPLPYPVEEPAEISEIQAHCYSPRKCWWIEGGICFNPIPDNPAYPHRLGAAHRPLDENPEKRIRQSMIEACKKDKWKQFDHRPEAEMAFLNSRCNGEVIEDMISVHKVLNCRTDPIAYIEDEEN